MVELRIDALSYCYPDSNRVVLDGLTARLTPGQAWWLSGPNGAGKTTLLEICCGLRLPTAGSVTLNGESVCSTKVAYLPSELPIFPELTVIEHGALISELWRLERRARENFTDCYFELVAALGIGIRTEKLAEFSKGMQEKVAIAFTIARPSEVVLLDEPFSALDARSLALCQDIIRVEAATRIFVIVSHLPDITRPLTPRRIHLPEGMLS